MSLASKLTTIKKRAAMLEEARRFFHTRNILEVDPGALVRMPPNDSNIDAIATDQEGAYLHTSPEYAMKRLLAAGLGDCYFLGRVYRKGEVGYRHNPEFTMAEWYRTGISFTDMIKETADFLSLFFGPLPLNYISYRDAFDVDIDSLPALQKKVGKSWPRETCLDYLLTHDIEPTLGKNCLTVILDFPPEQAALATTVEKKGRLVAERFEIYHEGVELSNGYHELSDAKELRHRFDRINQDRSVPYAPDEKFLAALETLPDCCGVALGFDRAFMLKEKLASIQEAIPFAWQEL